MIDIYYLENGSTCYMLNKEIKKETSRSLYFKSLCGNNYRYNFLEKKLYNLTTKKSYDVIEAFRSF